ncbi:MAG: homoserine kinase [Salaquimonas sp.]|jgi:homoserine kinase type II|nr:homoserine kinase [Salaquimonas sp.]
MAVYTDIRDDQLEAWLDRYDLGGLHAFKGIAEGVENSNFLLTTDNGSFILTLYEKRVDPADLPFFLGLMEHLAARGINCPRPVRMRSGAFLGSLAGRPAAVVTYLDGVSVRRPSPAHCRQVGDALAAMHLAGEDFTLARTNALSLQGWRPLFEKSGTRADEIEIGLADLITDELDHLETCWPSGLPAGVIHADLFRDNVFFLKDELSGIFDFYFACNDLFAYDVAICMNAWCFEPDWSFNVTKARALLEGYSARRPLSAEEFNALPVLCRGSALRFLLTRLYDWLNVPPGALVTPHDPREYLAKLRFHQGITDAGAYGLDLADNSVSGEAD